MTEAGTPRPDDASAAQGRWRRAAELAGARRAARAAEDRLWAAIEALPDAFVLYDAEDRVALFNTKYRDLYAASAGAIRIGATFEEILRAGLAHGQYPEAAGREEAWLAERLERHRAPRGPIAQELPGGRHLQIHEVRLPNGDTAGFRVDVTEIKRRKQELREKAAALEVAATTDSLTGLRNRRGLERAVAELARTCPKSARFGLLHVDLDRFKPINSVFGHAAGDFALRRVAEVLTRSVRREDVVARVGGDEFVLVLTPPCDRRRAMAAAQRILSQCSEPVDWNGKTLRFGASIGIALGPAADLPRMQADADIALYEAKKGGRNRNLLFNADLRHRVEARKALSDDLLAGLSRGEIEAQYQPQVDAADGTLVGFEALARWRHPVRGLLGPQAFLGIAEDLGLVPTVDRLICDHAIATGRALVAAGHALSTVSVNVSMGRLTEGPFVQQLPSGPCDGFRLSLEILEAVDVDRDFDEIAWVFDALRERGILIEVDDFGSGRASLTSLLKIRPDRVKLDSQIVRAALEDTRGAGAMVRAIAEMCHGLGIPMTAEGIETAEHARLVREMGCDLLQGYYVSPPLDRGDLLSWAAARSAHRTA
ncbi:putative bifunctional diguanylate cyclase/phosphodiesterase [Roseivivax isoporae]|nr:EAL domain-containing protein [Roseivivax isoporae]